MEGIIGVFRSRNDAEHAYSDLRRLGQPEDSIVFLTPEATDAELARVPTTTAENPGIGKAISSVVGLAVGGGAGMAIGSALAAMAVPGVGPILAAGFGAGALLGIGGAVAGAKLGAKSEEALDNGIPIDDVGRLRYLLKAGRTLIAVAADSPEKQEQVQALFNSFGAAPFRYSWNEEKAA